MRILLTKGEWDSFGEMAHAKDMTRKTLGTTVLREYLAKNKK